MKFIPTGLLGACLIQPEFVSDERGGFARVWCAEEFARRGLCSKLLQCNISTNRLRGTLRGMHMQREPYAEAKLVRCTCGSIYDVIIDLRVESPTYCRWMGFELSAENRNLLYIPEGFAHGFQTLTADTEVFYQMSEVFHADSGSGVRWNDPLFQIDWPMAEQRIMSSRDASYPDYQPIRPD